MKLMIGFLQDQVSVQAVATATTLCMILGIFMFFHSNRKRYHPVVGTILNLVANFNRIHHYMTELAFKNKTYRIRSLFRSQVYTSDPANVEYILKTNFSNYHKGWLNYEILSDLLGDGIFTVDGPKWQHQRKLASYEFTTNNLRNFSTQVFKTTALKLVRIVSRASSSNQTIEIQDLFVKSTLDSVFKVVLGIELDSMCGTYEEGSCFCDAFDKASYITLYRYFDVFWKLKRFLNIGTEAELKKSIKVVDEFVNKLIKSKMEQQPNSSQTKKGDILSRFLELKETDPKYLKDIILSFIVADKDTTASALSWFLYMLCKHPAVQERIAREIEEATLLKSRDISSTDELADSVTEEALEKMQYLHAALTETLRLYPSVPLEIKLCLTNDTMPDGYSVRRGDSVGYLPYVMGRMKALWGHDAEEFRPERWLDENGHFKQQSSFKFTAFQAGPRICMGKEFAYRQMKIFSAILLSSYKFKLSDEQKVVHYKTMVTLHIDGGLNLCASPRRSLNANLEV